MSKNDAQATDPEEKLAEALDRELIDVIDCDDAERMKQLLIKACLRNTGSLACGQ